MNTPLSPEYLKNPQEMLQQREATVQAALDNLAAIVKVQYESAPIRPATTEHRTVRATTEIAVKDLEMQRIQDNLDQAYALGEGNPLHDFNESYYDQKTT